MKLRTVINFSLVTLLLATTAQASSVDLCRSSTSIASPNTPTPKIAHNYEPAWSKAYRKGYLKYNQEDYISAKEYFTKAEKLGCPKAKHFLSILYRDGLGVKMDQEKASQLLMAAAQDGDLSSQVLLANQLDYEDAKYSDRTLRTYWLNKAANQGHTGSIWNIAVAYYKGDGLTPNIKKSYTLFERAAMLNHPESQLMTGIMNLKGQGVTKNKIKGCAWGNVAFANEAPYSYLFIAKCKKMLTEPELAETRIISKKWIKKRHNNEDMNSPVSL